MSNLVVSLCGILCVGEFVPAAWAADNKESNYQYKVVTCEEVEKLDPSKTSDPWEIGRPWETHRVLCCKCIQRYTDPGQEMEWLKKLTQLGWSTVCTIISKNLQEMTSGEQRKVCFSELSSLYLMFFAKGIAVGSTTLLVPLFGPDANTQFQAYTTIEGFEQAKNAFLQKRNDVEGFRWARDAYSNKHQSLAGFEQQAKKVVENLTLQFCVPKDKTEQFASYLGALKKTVPKLLKIGLVDDKLREFEKLPCVLKSKKEGKKKSSE